jgi:PAS domain S-box-containing protein
MVETTVYRLVQESLANVRRFADAKRARVDLRIDGERIRLTISDAGRGFDPQAVDSGEMGLRGLRERAGVVGGEVRVESAPDHGTTITALLPLLDPIDSAQIARDRAAADLLLSQTRLQQILDNTTAVIFVKDWESRYELINRRHEELFHLSRQDFIGKTDHAFLPPEVADQMQANDRRVVDEGKAITFEESVPSDGRVREYVTVKFPIPGAAGKPPSVCGIATDITEQKQQLRHTEEMRERFQMFINLSPNLAWIKDAEGKYVFANRRMLEIFNKREDEIVGLTDAEILPAGWAEAVRQHDLEVLATGGTHKFQEECPIGDGPPLVWEVWKFRLQASDGTYLVGGKALDATLKANRPMV